MITKRWTGEKWREVKERAGSVQGPYELHELQYLQIGS